MSNILSIQNISSGYKHKFMLKGISFDVKKASFTGIIGPNASGKTTLFKSIIGDLDLQAGKILLENENISNFTLKEKAKKLAIVTQNFDTPNLSVEDYVLLGRYPYNLSLFLYTPVSFMYL